VTYEIETTPEGLRHLNLNRLPDKVRAPVFEAIFGSIAENPQRAGKPLGGELEGLYSARRGEFGVIYEIDEAGRRRPRPQCKAPAERVPEAIAVRSLAKPGLPRQTHGGVQCSRPSRDSFWWSA
jgi:mRNA-degrading endonuclease RelE of RelBE toxin-antitoxin system